MTARDRLIRKYSNPYIAPSLTAIVVDGLLAEHAHELAEKIRGDAREHGSSEHIDADWTTTMQWAADLIDPEVDK